MQMKMNRLFLYLIIIIFIIILLIIFVLRKKDKYTRNWDCNPITGKCHTDSTGPFSSKEQCLRNRKTVCGKNAWDCNIDNGCHPDPWGGPYDSQEDCEQNSSCSEKNVPFLPCKVEFSFTPFGKNSCSGENCPTDQMNPGFYKICMIGLLFPNPLANCNQDELAQGIIDNFNCISPPISQVISVDGTISLENWQQQYNDYMASITSLVLQKASSQGKLMVVMPIVYGTASLFQIYKNTGNTQGFNSLYNQITANYDRKFIKGIIYDIENWDDWLDNKGNCPDGPLSQTVLKSKCEEHSPDDHTVHTCCLKYYLGLYLNTISSVWKNKEPSWEIYINTYLNEYMLTNEAVVTLAKSIKDNSNLGIQFQDYWRVDINKNGTIMELIKQVGSASKMIWGFGGNKTQAWKKSDLDQTLQNAKSLGFYGLFVWSGACYFYANKLIPMSCVNPHPEEQGWVDIFNGFLKNCVT